LRAAWSFGFGGVLPGKLSSVVSDPYRDMRQLSTALFVIVAVVNLVPLAGVLGAERLLALYGLSLSGADLLLLMQHRAVLLGLVGGLLLVAAFRPRLRTAAAVMGLGSMLSFLGLAWPLQEHGPAIQKVFFADVVASVVLVVALWVSQKSAESGDS
jgi:hypothetical protein